MGAAIDRVIDSGRLPDAALRQVIRALLRKRLAGELAGGPQARSERKRELIRSLRTSPVALSTAEANEQHYEVPTELFELMLGARLKYSSAHWGPGVTTLDQAEESMLALTAERAMLVDGQDILELGCGWGSLTLYMAERYPTSNITAISNSNSQREHIEKQAFLRGIDNVTVITRDVNVFGTDDTAAAVAGGFDRVVSVEMFEHVRNYEVLLDRIHGWLRPDGRLFVHIFAHRSQPYPFDAGKGRADWMARHFFTDGLMPSDDLLLHFAGPLAVDDHWVVDGRHYAKTCEAWLERLDANRERAISLLGDTYGSADAEAWFHRWRVFDLACAELFAFDAGSEWHVSHYRFHKRPS